MFRIAKGDWGDRNNENFSSPPRPSRQLGHVVDARRNRRLLNSLGIWIQHTYSYGAKTKRNDNKSKLALTACCKWECAAWESAQKSHDFVANQHFSTVFPNSSSHVCRRSDCALVAAHPSHLCWAKAFSLYKFRWSHDLLLMFTRLQKFTEIWRSSQTDVYPDVDQLQASCNACRWK